MHEHPFVEFLAWGHGAGALVFFVAMWVLPSFGISCWSGWHLLAERYRCEREFTGERWRFQSGRMRGGCGYNNCLTLGANADGLYLAVLRILPWHPQLFIPWVEITVREEQQWWGVGTVFTLGRETQIPLRVLKRIGDKLLAQRPTVETSAFPAPAFRAE